MNDTTATSGDTESVVRLESGEWYERRELAERLDVSLRTIDRRVKRGEIEKRQTPRGKVYRPAPADTPNDKKRHQNDTRSTESDTPKATSDDTTATPDLSQGVAELVDLVREQHERIVELERENARLEADLEDLRAGDVDPVPKADDSTSRAAELVDALRSTADST